MVVGRGYFSHTSSDNCLIIGEQQYCQSSNDRYVNLIDSLGGTQQCFTQGGSTSRSNRPYPFIYHFYDKRYSFCIPSIDKWYPSHLPSLECCIPFNFCKCTIFEIWKNYNTRKFSRLFYSHKFFPLALLGLYKDGMTNFPTLFLYFK